MSARRAAVIFAASPRPSLDVREVVALVVYEFGFACKRFDRLMRKVELGQLAVAVVHDNAFRAALVAKLYYLARKLHGAHRRNDVHLFAFLHVYARIDNRFGRLNI